MFEMNSFVALTIITILSFISISDNLEVTPMRIVCYRYNHDFVNSGWHYPTSNEKCTHVILKAGVLDRVTANVTHNTSYTKEYKQRFPNLKLILHLDPEIKQDNSYPQVITSKVGRSRLISSAVSLLKENKYDGLDVVFHKKYFSEMRLLLSEMHKEFNKHALTLSALFPSRWNVQDRLSDIAENLDFMNIRSFEDHTYSDVTKLSAPLYSRNSKMWSVDELIKTYLISGVPRSKIVMGIPTYAVTHELYNADMYSIGSHKYTKRYRADRRGILKLNEITGPGWVHHRDNDSQAPYASNYLLWASYDDDVSVEAKALYIVNNNLGGAMLSPFYDYDEINSALPFVTVLRTILLGK